MQGGVAVIDITPPAGLAMSGFAARRSPARGRHDALSVRAIVMDDTALIVCDVIGLHENMSQRIRHRIASCTNIPAQHIILAATHTHGAPASMAGRLSEHSSPTFLESLEQACVAALCRALESSRHCTASAGLGRCPGIARNRRDSNGAVDDTLPVLLLKDDDARVFAILVSHACHPVVLGADNTLYTADYPHYVRKQLEQEYPGSVALFALGACGDVNSGHSAAASFSLDSQAGRSFADAERIGQHIARCATHTQWQSTIAISDEAPRIRNSTTALSFQRRESQDNDQLRRRWQHILDQRASMSRSPDSLGDTDADKDVDSSLLQCWIRWAEENPSIPPDAWQARVSLLQFGALKLIALPGEQFACVALQLQELISRHYGPQSLTVVVTCAEGNPGYICPDDALKQGGYEPDEAHRYYRMPASFAPGSVSRLIHAVEQLLEAPDSNSSLDTQPVA